MDDNIMRAFVKALENAPKAYLLKTHNHLPLPRMKYSVSTVMGFKGCRYNTTIVTGRDIGLHAGINVLSLPCQLMGDVFIYDVTFEPNIALPIAGVELVTTGELKVIIKVDFDAPRSEVLYTIPTNTNLVTIQSDHLICDPVWTR